MEALDFTILSQKKGTFWTATARIDNGHHLEFEEGNAATEREALYQLFTRLAIRYIPPFETGDVNE